MREVVILEKKRHEVLHVFSGPFSASDQLGQEEKHDCLYSQGQVARQSMIQSTANDREISCLNRKILVMDLVDRLSRMRIEQLKIVVAIQPNTVSSIEIKMSDIDRK